MAYKVRIGYSEILKLLSCLNIIVDTEDNGKVLDIFPDFEFTNEDDKRKYQRIIEKIIMNSNMNNISNLVLPYIKNKKVEEILIDPGIDYLEIKFKNNKTLSITKTCKKYLNTILEYIDINKNIQFYKEYEDNKNEINNIIITKSITTSLVKYQKEDIDDINKSNNLYIFNLDNNRGLPLLNNNNIIKSILDDVYDKDKVKSYSNNNETIILEFDNINIVINDNFETYKEYIEKFQNDLIDRKIRKVYKIGEKHE